MRQSGDKTGQWPLSPEWLREELWRLFLGHGYLCRPGRAGPVGGDHGWEVRFVGLGAPARARLVRLLAQLGLPGAHRSERRGQTRVSVPGRRAVQEFRRLWRYFARVSRPG